jgi:SAM-dependent methyltransferase
MRPVTVWVRDSGAAVLRRVVPQRLRWMRLQRRARKYENRPPQERFSRIYRDRAWGRAPGSAYYSGAGSHDPAIASGYVSAVRDLISSLGECTVVDLGCGDFHIGSQLRSAASKYIACDVVPEMIESHRGTFADLDVDFRVIDMVADDLPPGDLCIIREVLQHLPNDEIAAIVPKLAQYRHVVITEQQPRGEFVANAPKGTGADVRTSQNPQSGVVLTEPPFNMPVESADVLHEVVAHLGVVRTMHYQPQR